MKSEHRSGNIGTIGHVDPHRLSLTAAITMVLASRAVFDSGPRHSAQRASEATPDDIFPTEAGPLNRQQRRAAHRRAKKDHPHAS